MRETTRSFDFSLFSLRRLALFFIVSISLTACLETGGGDTGGGSGGVPPVAGGGGSAGIVPPPADLTSVGIAGQTYYVATDGNDGNPGSLAAPFRSITKAVSVVNPGDTIEVRGGTYAGGQMITRRGRSDAWIKIKPYNDEHVVIDGAGTNIALYFLDNSWRLEEQDPMYWIVEGLEIKGGNTYVVKIDAPFVRLVNNNMYGSGTDIVKLVRTADDVVIFGNEVHHNNAPAGSNAQGIDMTGPDRAWVAHNYVHDTVSLGMYAKGNSRGVVFENNRLENIHDRGIMLGQLTGTQFMTPGLAYESYDGIIRNNVIINTDDACLATASSYNVKIYNNTCYNAATQRHGAIFISNEAESQQAGTNIEIKNNVIVVSNDSGRPAVWVAVNAMTDYSTLHIDNNVYWTPNGADAVRFTADDQGLWNADVNTWKATMHQDAHSVLADPKFSSTSTLELSGTSPAVDAGVATDVVTYDFKDKSRPAGGAIDIGAYEFGAS